MGESTSDTSREPVPSAEVLPANLPKLGTNNLLEDLSTVSQCLLRLEDGSAAPGVIDAALSGMLRIATENQARGATDAAELCDLGDQTLKAIRNGNLTASSPVIDALLEMCETMAAMAGATDGESESCGLDIAPLTKKLRQLLNRTDAAEPRAAAAPLAPTAWPAPGSGLAPDMVAEFKAESTEGLDMLEAILLEFERNPRDAECLRAIFRVVHNIKGAADYVGLAQIKTLSHRLEDILDLVRAGRCKMTASISDLVFRSVDELKAMIAALLPDGEPDRDLAALVSALEATKRIPPTTPPAETGPATVSDDELGVYASSAEQQLESITACCSKLAQGDASDSVLTVIHRGVTTLLAAATYLKQTPLALPAGELLKAIGELRQQRTQMCERFAALGAQHLSTQAAAQSNNNIVACCEEIVHGNSPDAELANLVRDLTALHQTPAQGSPPELVEAATTFVRSIEAFRETRNQHLRQLRTLSGEGFAQPGLHPEQGKAEPTQVSMPVVTSAAEQQVAAAAPKTPAAKRGEASDAPSGGAAGKTMRVDQGKLDDYINLAGELVIARNALVHDFGQLRVDGSHHHRLKESVERVQRIVADIQANAMSMRMVPVMSVFQRFPRMVRDIAKTQGKQIEIQLFGEETELDKQVAEKLGDPLVHLIRNSADHGIELPEVRQAAGKSESGLITLKAGREGSSIIIDIIDDGRGIDVARLKAKAVEKGILRQEQADAMPREKALELIFAAGLSTAKVVSDISGRGVGMDVVRSNITELGGTVSILSEDGKGSQIRLHLPLTLAVTTAILVSAQDCLYAVPMESVRETVKVLPETIRTLNGRHAISLRGNIVPVISLANVLSSRGGGRKPGAETPLGLTTDRSGRVPIVVVVAGASIYGVSVDELRGQQEIVIKPLPSQLGQLPGIGGATILGDGSVILILDPTSFADLVISRTGGNETGPRKRRQPSLPN